jgi:hypothetical protein
LSTVEDFKLRFWEVYQAVTRCRLLQEEDRVVIIRFGHDADPLCMQMDEVLASVADPIKNFAVTYLVDITAVRVLLHCAANWPALCTAVPS